ncbi:subtilisin-like protein [Lactarius quietus]|nr:subtilisin-like protein [Lactarius quietus]
MMLYHWFTVLAVFTIPRLACLATPLVASRWDDMHVKHAWAVAPQNWENVGTPFPNTTIDLQIALKPENENALVDTLYEVSTPRHPKYGAYKSKEEVAELVAPHPDTLELVYSWLAHHGVQPSSISITHGGGWLTVSDVPVSKADEILGATYRLYRYAGTNDRAIIRTVSYSLPKVLHGLVRTVVPTTFFASARTLQPTPQRRPVAAAGTPAKAEPRQAGSSSSDFPPKEVTPEYLRSVVYKTIIYTPVATNKNKIGIVAFNDDFVSPSDLKLFLKVFREDAIDAKLTVVKINGGQYNPAMPGYESNTCMQYTQSIAYPTPHIYYSIGGSLEWDDSGEPNTVDQYSTWFKYLLKKRTRDIPQTIVIPFGSPERILPGEYLLEVCFLFAQLSVRGVSVLVATGDDGVGEGDCKTSTGDVQFMPNFPASCPYVTSVGGTTSVFPEVGAKLSGGGFSTYFARPSYQKDVIPPYLDSIGNLYEGLYSDGGRGMPDISAQAVNYVITMSGASKLVNGTSASAPVVAGIIALLNDLLVSEQKPPLGWLNPWLYGDAYPGLMDVSSGNNPGCGTEGFPARSGWDPVTGLGTPDFLELMQVLLFTRIGGKKGRAFSELLNISDIGIPTRDGKEIDEYFLTNSSTHVTSAHKQN